MREAGSSGGAISALAAWMVDNNETVAGVAADRGRPSRTVPVQIRSRDEVLAAAGSRYAPVATLTGDGVATSSAIISKPCEAAAWRSVQSSRGSQTPLLISFFCAGVPSQTATDALIRKLGMDPDDLVALKYRGDGWPGDFRAVSREGESASMSYDLSWGRELGPTMQWRCKICPDGTARSADIVAGDYWRTDDRGYPLFENAEGESVLIARTQRGYDTLRAAADAGVIELEILSLSELHKVQPLQVERVRQLNGRLWGARLAGRSVPHFRGFGLWRHSLRHPIRDFLRPAVGSVVRTIRARKA
ncbi:hypothetical protein GCM10027411_19390 [Microbacterium aureliae]